MRRPTIESTNTTERRAALAGSHDAVYAGIFNALRDPCRVDMIRMIASRPELPCTTLDETFSISKSTISYHVKVLYHAGLISVRKEGRNYHYRLRQDVFEEFLPRFLERLKGERHTAPPAPKRAQATVAAAARR